MKTDDEIMQEFFETNQYDDGDSYEMTPEEVAQWDDEERQTTFKNKIDLDPLPEPTQKQIESGNYKKHHLRLHGFDISIENPKGSRRSGIDPNGEAWSVKMPAHYGYIEKK